MEGINKVQQRTPSSPTTRKHAMTIVAIEKTTIPDHPNTRQTSVSMDILMST